MMVVLSKGVGPCLAKVPGLGPVYTVRDSVADPAGQTSTAANVHAFAGTDKAVHIHPSL